MDSQKLHDWLQVIGIAAVVASLIFVGLQIKQSDNIALAEVLESMAARAIEERALVAAHADTWQKASLGEQAKEYIAAVHQRVGELEQLEPNPMADVRWCGVQ